jgi:hypothetical protein
MVLSSFNAWAGVVQLAGVGTVTLSSATPTGSSAALLGTVLTTFDGSLDATAAATVSLRGPLVVTPGQALSLSAAAGATLAANSLLMVNGTLLLSGCTVVTGASISGPGVLNLTSGTVQTGVLLNTTTISTSCSVSYLSFSVT